MASDVSGFLVAGNAVLMHASESHLKRQNRAVLAAALDQAAAGFVTPNTRRFYDHFSAMPSAVPSTVTLGDTIQIGTAADLSAEDQVRLHTALMGLTPWRKGPFSLFGIGIDTEWRSEMKWNRILPSLPGLEGKRILDVGCGDGYYLYRMAEQDPAWVLGVDSSPLCYTQFRSVQRYAQVRNVDFALLRIEGLAGLQSGFDVVFCMGVLYHARQPLQLLSQLKQFLRPGGVLVMESLVMDGEGSWAFCPHPTYAKMPNVHFIPTRDCLRQWMAQTGFEEVVEAYYAPTTTEEQRGTPWLGAVQSLETFLDPQDPSQTIEGYPAPRRAAFVGTLK